MKKAVRFIGVFVAFAILMSAVSPLAQPGSVVAATPNGGSLNPPAGNGTSTLNWTGGPYTVATPDPSLCAAGTTNCDTYALNLNIPANYWTNHDGGVTVEITWASSANDFDLYVNDATGAEVGHSGSSATTSEKVDLGKLAPGHYTVQTVAYLVTGSTYSGKASLNSTFLPGGMTFPEDKSTVMDALTVDYPLNVIFVGYKPTVTEVNELKNWIPDTYKPTVAQQSGGGDEVQNTGASLLNWNKNHLISSVPYFVGIKYNYKINIIQASDDYAKALFQVAENNTAHTQSYHDTKHTANMVKYDNTYGNYRVIAKGGDSNWKVLSPSKTDLIDAFSVEDWIFNSRTDAQWACAFKNLTTNACLSPSIIDPDTTAYHDPYYDKNGLNLERMPEGLNKGSSFFFLDTFTPSYAASYFRQGAYHTWGTDKVINGTIVPTSVDQGGSYRITDPDTGNWDGVDFARSWGGRYRFHFIDLGAAPNDYESASWLGAEKTMSSDYPFGDPPIWQYKADPQWQQTSASCAADPQVTDYTGGTPCRIMPRLGRDVAYGLFFRSTAGYLYRPIPQGDVYWLAVSNWTDFYSRPQWVNGQLTNAPWYGAWWTNMDKLYKIGAAGSNGEDVLRWLSSALPYARWVGRKGQVIPLYDPKTNKPTGKTLDTSPKYEDLPAPKYHVSSTALTLSIVPEPLYPGDAAHVIKQYGSSSVDLTALSNEVEKDKALGLTGSGYDDSVSDTGMRDYIDAHRPGIADKIAGVNTIPSINMVFEKAYTWALPAIVGGIAVATADGNAWGVMNNVNDRFKSSASHYPAVQPGDPVGSKHSVTSASLPSQDSGTGFSYTIEHEAAHNLGLSHPHDGSYGVDKCTTGPNTGKWECYWAGLGWFYDISAAPTTYAMSYRPYEVEDQDNLQRGHIAEYLLAAQDALRTRLTAEAAAGRTTPSAAWTADYNRMVSYRKLASSMFKLGDYLHAEYAARDGAMAARGILPTTANTIDAKLLEAGQTYYFNVKPQSDGTIKPDLTVKSFTATKTGTNQMTLTAVVANTGLATANNAVLRFQDGSTFIADKTIATLAKGTQTTVTTGWNTSGMTGLHYPRANADPNNKLVEQNEYNNVVTLSANFSGSGVTVGPVVGPDGTMPDSGK